MDVTKELPQSITISLDDEESFEQPVVYKYLSNACFHCGVKGHLVRDCPVKNPPISKPTPKPPSNTPQAKTHPPQVQRNNLNQPANKSRSYRVVEERHPAKQSNRFTLLATLSEWDDSKVPESSCAASEDEDDSSSRLKKQEQELDSEMVVEMNKTDNQELANKENVPLPPQQRSFMTGPYGYSERGAKQ
ncbi:hypothetical protein L7F22_001585 [Adiantum nelumboides]|nr:hypothetical protein [Adiantum nelumboides]